MNLQTSQIRLIRDWYSAAAKGLDIQFPIPMVEGNNDMLRRIRDIVQENPRIFRTS